MRSSFIPQLDAWQRGNRNLPVPQAATGASAGIPLLPGQLGPRARMVVEMAWGAYVGPGADPETWVWTDITTDVMFADGPSWFRLGRTDESSEAPPAELRMVLDNRASRYSLGGLSPNWPNVRENVPMRVRVDPDGVAFEIAWQGFAVGFTPSWDETGKIATVDFTAKGSLSRLTQNQVPRSPGERYMRSLTSPRPIIYYPLNDGPQAAVGQPAIGSGTAEVVQLWDEQVPSPYLGRGRLAPWLDEGAAFKEFAGIRCSIPANPASTSQWQASFLVSYVNGNPAPSGAVDVILVSEPGFDTAGWEIELGFEARVISLFKPESVTPLISNQPEDVIFDGNMHMITLMLTKVGADVWFQVVCDEVVMATAVVTNRAYVHPTNFQAYFAGNTDRYIGHLGVFCDGAPNVFDTAFSMLGRSYSSLGLIHYNETALNRMLDAAGREHVRLDMIGNTGNQADTEMMGPMPVNGLIDALQECAAADWGLLFDGLGPGLHYVTRFDRENAVASLVIDVSNRQLFPGFQPKHDDFQRVNRARAKRSFGSEFTYEDVDGPLGTSAVGTRERPIEINLDFDSDLSDFAAWLVHLGTLEGYRYPEVSINLRTVPSLARAVLALRPGSRIDLVNVDSVLIGHPPGPVSLIVEGKATTLSPMDWIVTLQCSAFSAWRIATLAEPTGDTSEFLGVLTASGMRTAAPAAPGSTSLVIESTDGTLWTQDSDDFPQYISVGGLRLRATACSGAASPQTLTVDPTPVGIPGLIEVQVWDAPVLGL